MATYPRYWTGSPVILLEELWQSYVDKDEDGNPAERDLKDKKIIAQSLFKNMSPINELPLPVGAQEIMEEANGWDYWRNEPIVDPYLPSEPRLQYDSRTSPTAHKLSNIVSESSVYASPARMNHLVDTLFGINKMIHTGRTGINT